MAIYGGTIMDSKSLMIGDILNLSDNDDEIIPCKVVELHTEELLIIQPGDTACDIVGYDMVRPMRLTPEILEKNGWKCTGERIWDIDHYINVIFEYSEITHSYLALQQDDEFGSYCFGVNRCLWEGLSINYVHELQHALRLCGLAELAEKIKV